MAEVRGLAYTPMPVSLPDEPSAGPLPLISGEMNSSSERGPGVNNPGHPMSNHARTSMPGSAHSPLDLATRRESWPSPQPGAGAAEVAVAAPLRWLRLLFDSATACHPPRRHRNHPATV